MGLFTDIYNTVAKFFRSQDIREEGDPSKSVAQNRLKLVLMQDRTNLTPKVLEQMRGELVDLLSKYLEMDKDLLELNFEHEGDQVALMLSIPVIRAKDEEEIEKALESSEEQDAVEEDVAEEVEEEATDVAEAETCETEESTEEQPKPKKRRSKKVTPPEELEGDNNIEAQEENQFENQNCDEENQELAEIVCENKEG